MVSTEAKDYERVEFPAGREEDETEEEGERDVCGNQWEWLSICVGDGWLGACDDPMLPKAPIV